MELGRMDLHGASAVLRRLASLVRWRAASQVVPTSPRTPSKQRSGSRRSIRDTRYTEPDELWEALRTGHVRLVRMSWLIKQAKLGKSKRRMPRRQEMPEEAYLTAEEVERWAAEAGGQLADCHDCPRLTAPSGPCPAPSGLQQGSLSAVAKPLGARTVV